MPGTVLTVNNSDASSDNKAAKFCIMLGDTNGVLLGSCHGLATDSSMGAVTL